MCRKRSERFFACCCLLLLGFVFLIGNGCGPGAPGRVNGDENLSGNSAKCVPQDKGKGPPLSLAQPFDREMQRLGEGLLVQLPGEKPLRLAVLDFTGLEGRASTCGRLLAQYLETELVRGTQGVRSVSVVERRSLASMMEEMKLNLSDLSDSSQCLELGKYLGASALLQGVVMPWSEGVVMVLARIVDAETSEILSAYSEKLVLPPGLERQCSSDFGPLSEMPPLVDAHNPNSPYRVRVRTDKAVYKIGDPVRVYVESDRAGHLYLFDIDSHGHQTLLLPNVYSRKPVMLEAGETFTSPESWFLAGEPPGRGYIKAVVSPELLILEKLDLETLSEKTPFRSLDGRATRGVVVNAMKMKGGFGTAWITIER